VNSNPAGLRCTHLSELVETREIREGIPITVWRCAECGTHAEMVTQTGRLFLYDERFPAILLQCWWDSPKDVIHNAGDLTPYAWWVQAIQFPFQRQPNADLEED